MKFQIKHRYTDATLFEAGCFFGTREEFVAILANTHGDNDHAREYTAALTLIDMHVEIWTPAVEEQAVAA